MSFWDSLFKPKVDVEKEQLKRDNIDLKQKLTDMINLNIEYKTQIEKLSQKPPVPLKPSFLVDGYVYKPKIDVEAGQTVELDNPADIYIPTDELRRIVDVNKWKELPLDKRFYEIWKFVIYALQYSFDQPENWQIPAVTLKRHWGDCEDGTILFITLCMLADIPADSVFNSLGWFKPNTGDKIGHSYPIIKINNEWYIAETTIDYVPNWFIKFKGSQYDASWGMHNWIYSGALKDGEVNGYQI